MLIEANYRLQYLKQIQDFNDYLNQSYQNMQNLIETLQSGLVMFNSDLTLKNVNIKAKELLDCDNDDFMGIFRSLKYHRSEQLSDCVFETIQQQNMSINDSVALGNVLVNEKHVSLNISRIQWDDGSVYVLLLTDVTDTVQLETTNTENKLKSIFLNFIPHELQTPTVGILGCTEGMIEDYKKKEFHTIESNLNVILQSARSLHLLICNITDYTQIISKYFKLRKEESNIRNTLACLLYTSDAADE